jgi:hypothetical protein
VDYGGDPRPSIDFVADNALDEGDPPAWHGGNSAPSWSCTLAGRGITVSSMPMVSVGRWRLRPMTFLPASSPNLSSGVPPFTRPSPAGCR